MLEPDDDESYSRTNIVPLRGIVLSEIAQLLELQSIDAKIVELSFQVKRFDAHRKELEGKIAEARAAVGETRADLKQLEHDSRMMNLDVDELDANIRDYQVR